MEREREREREIVRERESMFDKGKGEGADTRQYEELCQSKGDREMERERERETYLTGIISMGSKDVVFEFVSGSLEKDCIEIYCSHVLYFQKYMY